MLHTPFYDPNKTYEENYNQGPFGTFADGKVFENQGEPKFEAYGHKVYSHFGIPTGPLINSNFVKAAFEKGFDIAVYKTVRSGNFPCHPYPNVLAVHPDGDLTMEKMKQPVLADTDYQDPISITNSFGVPSRKPEIWQDDVKKAINYAGSGQMMILSFMGTTKENQSPKEFIEDHRIAAKLSKETGAKVLEVNLSCPNIGNEGLICYDLEMSRKVCEAIKNEIGNTPLALKVGYYENNDALVKFAAIANEYAQDVSAINTLQATIVDSDGDQALPGKNREKSGVCGASIKWAGVNMVTRLKKIKDEKGYKFSITGIGGITTPQDFEDYRKVGADIVMSATGSMWNPYLAREIKSILQ